MLLFVLPNLLIGQRPWNTPYIHTHINRYCEFCFLQSLYVYLTVTCVPILWICGYISDKKHILIKKHSNRLEVTKYNSRDFTLLLFFCIQWHKMQEWTVLRTPTLLTYPLSLSDGCFSYVSTSRILLTIGRDFLSSS